MTTTGTWRSNEAVHPNAMQIMAEFARKWSKRNADKPRIIVDYGSQSVNGSCKGLFKNKLWTYIGIDMVAGHNVNIVLKDPYDWREIKSAYVDLVISCQAFEHTEYPWMTILEIARILKKEGQTFNVAPSRGSIHRFPVDCYRIKPDGWEALYRYAGLKMIECRIPIEREGWWSDCYAWGIK